MAVPMAEHKFKIGSSDLRLAVGVKMLTSAPVSTRNVVKVSHMKKVRRNTLLTTPLLL